MGDEEEVEVETCSQCGEPEGECNLHDVCGEHFDDCDCCGQCDQTQDDCDCCGNCSNTAGNCCCCSICAEPEWDCTCCHDCQNVEGECECEHDEDSGSRVKHDAVTVPPWQERGVTVNAVTDKNDWTKKWTVDNDNIDPIQSAADFYLLEAAAANVFIPIPSMRRLTPLHLADERFFEMYGITSDKEKAQLVERRNKLVAAKRKVNLDYNGQLLVAESEALLDDLVDMLAKSFEPYSHMAIGGELRHHPAVGGPVLNRNDRSAAWVGWRKVFDEVGVEAFADAMTMFNEFRGASYGGRKWAACAEVLYDYLKGDLGPDERINKRMFVDRIWTLEHNGGSFLNKLTWATKNRKTWNLNDSQYMRRVLDMHAANPPQYKDLLRLASPGVVEHLTRLADTSCEINEAQGLTVVNWTVKPPSKLLCQYCNGNGKYGHMSVKCHGLGNTPLEVEEDEWDNYYFPSTFDDPDAHMINNDGELNISPSKGVTFVWSVGLQYTDGSDDYFDATVKTTVENAENVTWTIADHIPGHSKKKQILHVNWGIGMVGIENCSGSWYSSKGDNPFSSDDALPLYTAEDFTQQTLDYVFNPATEFIKAQAKTASLFMKESHAHS